MFNLALPFGTVYLIFGQLLNNIIGQFLRYDSFLIEFFSFSASISYCWGMQRNLRMNTISGTTKSFSEAMTKKYKLEIRQVYLIELHSNRIRKRFNFMT